MFRQLLTALALLWVAVPASGQVAPAPGDSLRSYELSEIVIGETAERSSDPAAVRRVPLAEIVRSDAASVASVARLVPAAHVQTNSRGETLVYLRGAGERQVAVFLDGALLNIPWDNRIDLSFVPSSVLGSVGVAHGASSVLYGTNTVGGVLLLTTRSLDRPGRLSEISLAGGTVGWKRAEGLHQQRWARGAILASAGYTSSDGSPVPGGFERPFEPTTGRTRANTDHRLAHVFARADMRIGVVRMATSVLHADGKQGVAPEGHLDPSIESVRYWRYPRWRMTLATLNALADLGDTHLRATTWYSKFGQRIDQYTAVDYRSLDAREDDDDATFGGRVSLERTVGTGGTIVAAATVYSSDHRQEDRFLDIAGNEIDLETRHYRQQAWSLGAELRSEWTPGLRGIAGVGYEGVATPLTGDKPPRASQSSWTAAASMVADVGREWSVRLAAGRKLRFPTPRELFGTALGRFLVNDDLRPETAYSFDAGVVRPFEDGEIETTLFFRRTYDTIDQENVAVDGKSRRRRINLAGSSTIGVEIAGRLEPREGLELEGHVTAMHGRVIGENARTRLVEKPEVLSTLAATWRARRGVDVTLQGTYTGRAWGLGQDNSFVALPRALLLDVRLTHRRMLGQTGVFAEFFVRVNNLFDSLMMPQLGLPSAGRSARAGLSLAF